MNMTRPAAFVDRDEEEGPKKNLRWYLKWLMRYGIYK